MKDSCREKHVRANGNAGEMVQDTWVLSYDMVSLNVLLNRVLHVRNQDPATERTSCVVSVRPSTSVRVRACKGARSVYRTYDEATLPLPLSKLHAM
jgi:hypothetical protein